MNYKIVMTSVIVLLININCEGLTGNDLYLNTHGDNFIIRWGFQSLCQHTYDPRGYNFWPTILGNENGVRFDPKDVKAGDIVFVRKIDDYMKELHPHIKNPYVMVTGGEHLETVKPHQLKYLDDNKIIAWFAIHPPKIGHKKFFPIPQGVKQEREHYQNNKHFSAFFNELRSKEKTKLVYLNLMVKYNPGERGKIMDLFQNKPYVSYQGSLDRDPNSFIRYMKEMADCKFVFSPRGLGPDCYRTWEALMVGTIPIVRRNQGGNLNGTSLEKLKKGEHSVLDTLYEGLPILVIDEWEEVTEEFLNRKYREITSKKYDPEKLYLPYWKNKIHKVRDDFMKTLMRKD